MFCMCSGFMLMKMSDVDFAIFMGAGELGFFLRLGGEYVDAGWFLMQLCGLIVFVMQALIK